eukprot:229099-Chlamydomonas_euryale.AAC.13
MPQYVRYRAQSQCCMAQYMQHRARRAVPPLPVKARGPTVTAAALPAARLIRAAADGTRRGGSAEERRRMRRIAADAARACAGPWQAADAVAKRIPALSLLLFLLLFRLMFLTPFPAHVPVPVPCSCS